MEHHLALVLALVAALGMVAQWLAWRLRLPAIILLALAGLFAGPVMGWLQPSQDLGELLDPIIKLGVAIILFEGGLNLHFHEFRKGAAGLRRLVTVGVVLSLFFGALAAHYIGGLSWPVAMVFGAIIVVTGPTVIIPLLRQAHLRKRPASYLKWEGIINDPTGALLAVLLFQYFVYGADTGMGQIASHLGMAVLVAVALGAGFGYTLGVLYRRGFVPEYLKGPGALAAAMVVYVLANLVFEESGLLATTVLGVVMGNMRLPSIGEIRRFKESIAIIIVSGVFIILTADLDPSILLHLDWRSVGLLLAIVFLVRPLSIFLSTVGTDMSWQERSLLAWIAPRGIVAAAVAGVFAPQLQEQGYAGAELLLPLVFSLIFITVVLHGLSIGKVARYLDLSAQASNGVLIVGSTPWTVDLARALMGREVPVMIVDSSWHRLRAARLAGIPVFYGEILSELTQQNLEFVEAGYLFAATDNDSYNSLVCSHYAAELGRNHIFQLPYPESEEAETRQLQRTARGLFVPAEKVVFEDLLGMWYRGWTFQRTNLTESFGYEDWSGARPEGSIPVAIVRNDGEVIFNASEQTLKPRVDDVLLWFGPKTEKSRQSQT